MKGNGKELSERKKVILKAIVDSHIMNGEPVGSKTLTECKQLVCSSATIRSEMAELEEMGYLEQPHTSAGRVPSELGYRFYVDQLVNRYNVTNNEIERIRAALSTKLTELDDILYRASKLASALTDYTGIAVKPKRKTTAFSRYEAVWLDEHSFLLLMMAGEEVKTRSIRTAAPVTPAELEKLSQVLNASVAGLTADEITLPIICGMEAGMGSGAEMIAPIIKCIYEVMSSLDRGGDVRTSGVDRLLRYPEYTDVGRLQGLLGAIEKKDELIDLVSRSDGEEISVYIGSENQLDILGTSSLVLKPVKKDGKTVGAIGILGPRRMEYSKVIAMIEKLADGVRDVISPDSPDNSGAKLPPGNAG